MQSNFDTTDTLSYSTPLIASIFGKSSTEFKKTLSTRFYPLSHSETSAFHKEYLIKQTKYIKYVGQGKQ